MDLEDIDSWYEEKKAALEEKYLENVKKIDSKKTFPILLEVKKDTKIEKNKSIESAKEKLKKKFEKDMVSLHKEYEKKSKKVINKNLKNHFSKHRIDMLKTRFLDWKPVRDFLLKHQKKKKEGQN